MQTGTSSTPAATQNPFIPQGISSGCTDYLVTLNNNAELAQCIKPITDATAQFGPSSNNSTTPSVETITSALDTLCSSQTSSCSDTTLRQTLSEFTKACSAELTGSNANAAVIRQYDVIYVLTPMKQAVCSRDDSGKYCVTQISDDSASSGAKLVDQGKQLDISKLYTDLEKSDLQRRQSVVTQNHSLALVPNTSTFRNEGIPFLYLTPQTDSSRLCTSCTRVVLTAYINFEQSVPYIAGLPQSPLLGGQPALYVAVNGTCGPAFLSGAVQAAGGLANGNPLSFNAGVRVASEMSTIGALFAAAVAGFAALL